MQNRSVLGGVIGLSIVLLAAGAVWRLRREKSSPGPETSIPTRPVLDSLDSVSKEENPDFTVPVELKFFESTHLHLALIPSGTLRADLEPCGCTSPPTGGISRVASLRDVAIRHSAGAAKVFVVNSGDSLLDASSRLLRSHPDLVRLKAQVVKKYFDRIALDYMGLGEEDLALGLDRVSDFFPAKDTLISTNIQSSELPARAAGLETINGASVLFLSVMDKEIFTRRGLDAWGLKWSDPRASIRTAIARVGKPHLTIVFLHAQNLSEAAEVFRANGDSCATLVVENIHLNASGNGWNMLGDALRLIPSPYGRNVIVTNLFIRRVSTPRWRDLNQLIKMNAALSNLRRKVELAKDPKVRKEVQSLNDFLEGQKREELVRLGESNVFHVASIPVTAVLPEDELVRSWIDEYNVVAREAVNGTSDSPMLFTGADRCATCHPRQHANWMKTLHAVAYSTLVAKKEDRNPNCLQCHVSGFGYPGGPSRIEDITLLKGVQCESCHVPTRKGHPDGPVPSFSRVTLTTCLGCHTPRQDPRFDYARYLKAGTCLNDLAAGEERVNPLLPESHP